MITCYGSIRECAVSRMFHKWPTGSRALQVSVVRHALARLLFGNEAPRGRLIRQWLRSWPVLGLSAGKGDGIALLKESPAEHTRKRRVPSSTGMHFPPPPDKDAGKSVVQSLKLSRRVAEISRL